MCSELNVDMFKEDYWNSQRTQLLAWFKQNAPGLGELYKSALRSLHDKSLPARFIMLAHAVREIRNRLPDTVESIIKSKKISYENRLDEIISALKKNNFQLENMQLPASNEVVISLPHEASKLLAKLISDHSTGKNTGRRRIIDFFFAMAPEDVELRQLFVKMISEWYDVTERFFKIAHINSIEIHSIDEVEINQMFSIFEKTLFALLCEYFSTKGEIDDVLAEANKTTS